MTNMPKKWFYLVFVFLLALAFPASAADYLPKNQADGGNVTVAGDQAYRNLYIGGGTVSINKNILGDLFAAGGSVNVSSPVEKDLFAAGGNINVSGAVGEDARIAGGNISISAPVGGDLLIAGGTVNIAQAARVSRDLWAAGGAVNLNGEVAGSLKLAGGEILINSRIGGDVNVKADTRLVFGPQARVAGKIIHSGPKEAVVQDGAQISAIEFHKVGKKSYAGFGKLITLTFLFKLLALLAAALLAVKFLPRTAASVVKKSQDRPWYGLAVGFGAAVLIPLAAAIAMITIVGIYAGWIVGVWYVLALSLAVVFKTLFLGSTVEKLITKKDNELSWKTAIWGVLTVGILMLIPIVGWIVLAAACLVAFGGMMLTMKERLENFG